jgi:hypothetical protein
MSTEAATLPSNVDQLQAIIAAQASTIDELHTKLRKLEHHLRELLRARYGPRAERFDAAQLALFDAAADEVGPVDVFASRIESNQAVSGAGMLQIGATLEILDTEISDNVALYVNGGLAIANTTSALIDRVTITRNRANYRGGLVVGNNGSPITISNTTISENEVLPQNLWVNQRV